MKLEPFGRLRINRTREKPTGRVTVCRVRQRARPRPRNRRTPLQSLRTDAKPRPHG